MIALEEGIDRELPVDAGRDAVDREDRKRVEPQRREVVGEGAQLGIDVDRAGLALAQRRRLHEHHAMLLGGRQAHQAVRREIHAGEACLVGRAQQAAGPVIGPGVVGADEDAGIAAALGNRCAAMAADIGEGAKRAVAAAGQQHRHAGDILGQVIARLGQPGRQAHEDRARAEQPVALEHRAFAAGIGAHAIAEHRAGEVGGTAVDMAEQPPPDGQFFFSVHGQILVFRTAGLQSRPSLL